MVRIHLIRTGSGRRLFLDSILAVLTSVLFVSPCSAQTLSQSPVPDWQKAAGARWRLMLLLSRGKRPHRPTQ